MQVTQQLTRVQKKRAKMAAKKQAKEAGIPLPKKTKNYQQRKKSQPAKPRFAKPKTSSYVHSVARNQAELQRMIEDENNLQLSVNDINYPERPAYTLDFYVSNNVKYLNHLIEFPEELVTFQDPKKSCSELYKMLDEIGLRFTLAKIEIRQNDAWICNSMRLFVYPKDQSPLFHYVEKGVLPNPLPRGSVRTTEAILTIDLEQIQGDKIRLYLTNIDGERVTIGSYLLDDTMIEFRPEESRVCFAKDIEYAMRCALLNSLEGKLYKLAQRYFEGDITSMFLSSRVVE